MALVRLYFSVLVPALAVQAGIFYLMAGLGASGDLIVAVEMIWLAAACALGGFALLRHERRH